MPEICLNKTHSFISFSSSSSFVLRLHNFSIYSLKKGYHSRASHILIWSVCPCNLGDEILLQGFKRLLTLNSISKVLQNAVIFGSSTKNYMWSSQTFTLLTLNTCAPPFFQWKPMKKSTTMCTLLFFMNHISPLCNNSKNLGYKLDFFTKSFVMEWIQCSVGLALIQWVVVKVLHELYI